MKYIDEGYPDLLLFFAGWSASPDSFARLAVPERTDYWVVYDYRDMAFPEFAGYEHVDVVAWSLGVWVAAAVLPAPADSGNGHLGKRLFDAFGV